MVTFLESSLSILHFGVLYFSKLIIRVFHFEEEQKKWLMHRSAGNLDYPLPEDVKRLGVLACQRGLLYILRNLYCQRLCLSSATYQQGDLQANTCQYLPPDLLEANLESPEHTQIGPSTFVD